ncbi:MAG: aldo/keto reductase [Bacilli bacterium]
MKYINLGNSGLKVSQIGLGCMTFGNSETWIHSWVLDEQKSIEIIKYALDKGINFFDTANVYSIGDSEAILGKALKQYARREDVVIATKVGFPMDDKPTSGGLSRKSIMHEVEQSLQRLDTDYIDLYIIHRWDYNTPIEETMKALHDLVESGKVRYLGASSMYAWQFAKAQQVTKENNWTQFISMQNHLNLLYREEEREMQPLCIDQNIAMTPYSPLAAGRLARPLGTQTNRSESDEIAKLKYNKQIAMDDEIVNRVEELSKKYNVNMSVISLAWLYTKQNMTAPIVGASKTKYIDDALQALDLKLDSKVIHYLEELYTPRELVGPLASGSIKI